MNDQMMSVVDPATLEDAAYALSRLGNGGFKGIEGDYVAIYNKAVVGSGDNDVSLRIKCSEEQKVPVERIVIEFKGSWG